MTKRQKVHQDIQLTDEEGFLLQPEKQTKKVDQILTLEEIPEDLTHDHWIVIDCVRKYYLKYGTIPPIRLVAHQTGFLLSYIQRLFPQGFAKGVCKIAGIPRNAIKATPTLNSYQT